MALCSKCMYMDEKYDSFRQEYDDTIVVADTRTKHFCIMYDDSIPMDIYYENAPCEWYEQNND